MGKPTASSSPSRDELRHLKLRHLSCALHVARSGSLRRTAEALCVTESAVSKTLRELETELGVRLFERTPRGMVLTDAGRRFASHASIALDTLQAGVALASSRDVAAAATLRIAAMPVVAATFLPEVARRFLRQYPSALVEVASGPGTMMLSRLRDGLVELVLGREPPATEMSGLEFEQLYLDRHVFAVRAGHPLAGRKRVTPTQLVAYPLLLPQRQTVAWRDAQEWLGRGTGEGHGARIEAMDLEFSRACTLSMDAVWYASERAAAGELAAGTLVRIRTGHRASAGRIGIIARRGEVRMPQLQMIIDIVREASADFLRTAPRREQG